MGRYCANCGQKIAQPPLTVRGVLTETTQELTNWDGKVPRTLRALFLDPGRLSMDFLAGKRARWLAPLRVYLICSLVFFAVKPLTEGVTGRSPSDFARLEGDGIVPGRPLSPEVRQAIAEGLPGRIFSVEKIEQAVINGQYLDRELYASFPKAMFVLVPFYALLTSLAWRRARTGYAAHVYVALHIHALLFGAMTFYWILATATPFAAVRGAAFVAFLAYVAWYGFTTFRRVFSDSSAKTLVKCVVLAVVYWVSLMITAFALMALALRSAA